MSTSTSADALSFNKNEINEYLSKTLKTCLTATENEQDLISSLNKLTECMQQHGSWFGNHRSKIEPFLLKFLEHTNVQIVKEAAIAFHYFNQTGSAGIGGVNYTNNFLSQFKKLCATVHSLYDILFESESEIVETKTIESVKVTFSPISLKTSPIEVLEIISNEIRNCLIYLEAMILKGYPVDKLLTPQYLIDIAVRGLSVHICLMGQTEVSQEIQRRSAIFIELQIRLLEFLEIVIKGLQYFSITLPTATTKVLFNTLKRSFDCDCFSSQFRVSIYKVLSEWLQLIQSSSQNLQEMFLPIILKDITPPKTQVELKVPPRSKSKKRKHKSLVATETVEEKSSPADVLVKEINCLYALKALKFLIRTRVLPKSTEIQDLIFNILKILNTIHTNIHVLPPYSNVNCQAELYEILITLYKSKHVQQLPPIHNTIRILNVGLTNRSNTAIPKICRDGLDYLEKISQPLCPSLNVLPAVSKSKYQLDDEEVIDLKDVESDNELSEAYQTQSPEVRNPVIIEIEDVHEDINAEKRVSEGKEVHQEKNKAQINIISDILIKPTMDSQVTDDEEEFNVEVIPEVSSSIETISKTELFQEEIVASQSQPKDVSRGNNGTVKNGKKEEDKVSEEPDSKKLKTGDDWWVPFELAL